MQLNYNNFFRWYTGSPVDDTINIPRIGKQDGCRHYRPCIQPGEVTGLCINTVLPFLDNDLSANLHLRIVGGPDLGAVLTKAQAGSGYRLLATFALPFMTAGVYRFEVYNTATSTQKCISNDFRVVADGNSTCYVRFRNSRSIDNYDYESYPDFYNAFRLNLSLGAYTGESAVDSLQNVATGQRRLLNGSKDKSIPIYTYYFDDGAHDAVMSMIEHDYIEINGRAYLKNGSYNPNARQQSGVSIGEFTVYEQAYSSINKFGQVPEKRKAAKLISVGNEIRVYSANNVQVGTYTGIVYDTSVPYGGSAVVQGSGSAQVTYVNMNGGLTTDIRNKPVTIQQSELYGVDWVVV